jgi:TRAP-type C4-dicarboxylate transport system permease small subunit
MQNSEPIIQKKSVIFAGDNILKFDNFIHKTSNISADIASVFLLLLFVLNCTDIIGSKFFIFPVPGSVELTGYLQALLIPAASALVLFSHMHIKIEIVTEKLPKRVIEVMDGIVSLALFVLVGILIWQIIVFGMAKQDGGEYSNTLHWPFYIVIYLMALAFVPLCLALLRNFIFGVKRGGRK